MSVKSALIWNESFRSYRFQQDHPFNPRRLEMAVSLIEALGLIDGVQHRMIAPRTATDEELLRVHSPEYVEAVRRLSRRGAERSEGEQWGLGTEDNPIFVGMHEATARVVGGTMRAAELVVSGEVDRAFAIAGGLHHAHRDRASGFCVYSDLGAAIAWIRETTGARVMYIDYDAHHGDGVQGLFYSDPGVLTLSLHESGRFLFPGTGFIDELGEGEGYGFSLNVPMEPQTEDDSWIGIYREILGEAAAAFRPEIIVLQSGVDAHVLDPLAHLRCTTRLFEESVRITAEVAEEYCGGRMIVTGGGGYAIWRVVPRAWTLVWATMTGQTVKDPIPRSWLDRWEEESPRMLPELLRDPADSFPPVPRRTEIEATNRRTLEALKRTALPLLNNRSRPL
ncbi:MAG: acetoin utilization protein AcuC [Gemmatimonadota bacterium]|nr:acetoin utilization protein AcuC [Gemmatimonadota bacterium]